MQLVPHQQPEQPRFYIAVFRKGAIYAHLAVWDIIVTGGRKFFHCTTYTVERNEHVDGTGCRIGVNFVLDRLARPDVTGTYYDLTADPRVDLMGHSRLVWEPRYGTAGTARRS